VVFEVTILEKNSTSKYNLG